MADDPTIHNLLGEVKAMRRNVAKAHLRSVEEIRRLRRAMRHAKAAADRGNAEAAFDILRLALAEGPTCHPKRKPRARNLKVGGAK